MTRSVNRLSARQVASLKKPGRHADGNRLYLSVGKGAQRRWVYMYASDGVTQEMGLGLLKDVALAHARTKARNASALLADLAQVLWTIPKERIKGTRRATAFRSHRAPSKCWRSFAI